MIKSGFLIVLFISMLQGVFAQTVTRDDLEEYYRKKQRNKVFWAEGEPGVYLGVINEYQLKGYGLGAEAKFYASYHNQPIWSGALYTNYNYRFDSNGLNHSFGVGVQVSILALETNFIKGKEGSLWSVTPKIGLDLGSISLFYGYSLPLINTSQCSWREFHRVSFKYFLFMNRKVTRRIQKEG